MVITSSTMLTETAHRLMTIEACDTFGWPFTGIIRRLRNHPDKVKQLTRFRLALDEILAMGVRMLAVSPPLVFAGADISQQTGLLSNDALIVAVLRDQGLTHLASHDTDFDRVPGLTRYGPI